MGRPKKNVSEQPKRGMASPTPTRTGGRLKKAKIVFDPSVNNAPRRRVQSRTSSMNSVRARENQTSSASFEKTERKSDKYQEESSDSNNACSICSRSEFKKTRYLITCQDCNFKVHPPCVKIDFEDVNILEKKYRCDDCRTCKLCYEGSEEGSLITCVTCVESYHYTCHVPKVIGKLVDKFKWKCIKCNVNNTAEERASPPPKLHQPNKDYNNATKVKKPQPLPSGEIPHVKNWTSDQVANYFENYFPNEAFIFKDHDIDGSSLLLIKRSDIIRKMPFKLGPSLKLYSFILNIQTRSNDPTQSWM